MSHPAQTPIQVEVTNHPQPKKSLQRAAFLSAVLQAGGQTFVEIAGPDPLREKILIFNAGQTYVVCGSQSQAQDPNNQAATITNPNGMYVKAGAQQYEILGQNEVWLAGAPASAAIIGYQIIRKVPE